jgi:hypothetical protein
VIVCVNAALRQSTSSVKSAEEEEAEPRRRVISNGNIKFEIVKLIAPIDLISPLARAVQRRSFLIFQGVTEENKELVQIYFAWQAYTNTPVLFKARIMFDARFLPNIPINCPHMPILRAKPSGQAWFPDLF